MISAGHQTSCGITLDLQVTAGGKTMRVIWVMELAIPRVYPTPITGNYKFRYVSAARDSICAITPDDDLYGWGRNVDGEVGNGPNKSILSVSLPIMSLN